MTIAIHYNSVMRPDDTREVFGLQIAITNWLKAYFLHSKQEHFTFLIGDKAAQDEVYKLAADAQLDLRRLTILDQRYARENFGRFETIFRADPDPHNLLWQRQQINTPRYNVCSLAHAISGLEAGEVLERYCLDPSEATDAIICPSQAVAKAIRAFWSNYSDYIQKRFGAAFECPVQLPVIPLGVDVRRFERITTPDKRVEQRQKLGIQDDEIVVLWVGRLSHAIKAHPLAMFQTAERAAEKTGAKIHLVMCGYFVPQEAETGFHDLANAILHKAKVSFIASNDPRFPEGLWAAGDIFLSLIDNMQESFGLTPIEAMAAGLPRVISDWDGYRDSVTHGEDGFLIRTLQPPAGNGRELSELLLSGRDLYGGYLAKAAQCVAVDQEMAADALTLLIQDKNKRRAIADKARQRVRAIYDWPNIITAYEALWKDLATQRRKIPYDASPWPSALPQAPDPFQMYASYPSSALLPTGILKIKANLGQIEMLWQHSINVVALDVMLPPEQTLQFIRHIAERDHTHIEDLLVTVPGSEAPKAWRTLAWLIKLGILAYSEN